MGSAQLPKMIDLTGQQLGALKVVRRVADIKKGRPRWLCICECGSEIVTTTASLRRGTETCKRCSSKGKRNGRYTHGHADAGHTSRTYRIWQNMRSRCLNPNFDEYPRYGGSGIKVCEKWSTFTGFLDDMGECPEGRSLDRIDGKGNYEKSNCRWATPLEQSLNTSRTIKITIDGETKSLRQWCFSKGLNYQRVYQRVWRGADPLKAMEVEIG